MHNNNNPVMSEIASAVLVDDLYARAHQTHTHTDTRIIIDAKTIDLIDGFLGEFFCAHSHTRLFLISLMNRKNTSRRASNQSHWCAVCTCILALDIMQYNASPFSFHFYIL